MRRLLRINYDVVQSLMRKKLKAGELMYIEGLALKLFGHAASSFALWRDGTRLGVPEFDFLKKPGDQYGINFVDWSSAEVLARACVEVVIAFNYVYVQPTNADEADFRCLAWMLAGFKKRETFPVQSPEGIKRVAIDAKVNARQTAQIQKTGVFKALPARVQKQVLQGRDWHPDKTLSALCEDVFGLIWGRSLYAFMSSHAHSDGLSAVQVLGTGTQSKALARTALIAVSIALAHMTAGYASKWVVARKVYKSHPYRDLNEFYISFAGYAPSAFGLPNP
jgi:hypothetical protein